VESAAALAVCQLLPDTPADLDGLRCRLDETDAAILELFDRRQRLSAAIGAYKSAHGLPVRDKAREAEVLRTRGDMLPERRDQAERLMTLLMALSREEQA
jgi:chorismate mutase/prephenate dehydratase